MNRREAFLTATGGILALTTRAKAQTPDLTLIQPALEAAWKATVTLAKALKANQVPAAVSANFVSMQRIAMREMDQIGVLAPLDVFLRSAEGKAGLLSPPTAEVIAHLERWAVHLGLDRSDIKVRATTAAEYASIATLGVLGGSLWLMDAFERTISPYLPAAYAQGRNGYRLMRIQQPTAPPPPPPPPLPPVPTPCQVANAISAMSNTLWTTAGMWGMAGLMGCYACEVVAMIMGTGAGATGLASSLVQLSGTC